jgi:hypothetical protein
VTIYAMTSKTSAHDMSTAATGQVMSVGDAVADAVGAGLGGEVQADWHLAHGAAAHGRGDGVRGDGEGVQFGAKFAMQSRTW